MISVNDRRLIPMIAITAVIIMAFSSVILVPSEEADAASSTEWYTYGLHLEFRDRSYNETTYERIEWTYSSRIITSEDPGTTMVGDPNDDYALGVDLSSIDYPSWENHPLFVIETAYMRSGDVKSIQFIVNVNPIPEVCYVQYMFDDDNGYWYGYVTRSTSMAVGVDPLVDLPVDPAREGYTFGGWFLDRECTEPFNNMDPKVFESETTIIVYPKWIPTGGYEPSPETEIFFVALQMVDGLEMDYGGMAVPRGSSFTFTVSALNGYRFDLSGLNAVTGTGKQLDRVMNPDGSVTFTLSSVTSDTTVMLTGYKQYFKVALYSDDVSTVGFDEWVLQGTSLTLPLKSDIGGDVTATVFMAGADVTGNTFSDGVVRIASVNGDVSIYASSVEKPASSDGGIDLWMYIAIAAIIIALVLAIILIRRYRSG